LLADSRVEELADGIVSYSGIDDYCGDIFIRKSALEQIDGSRLFSPCCGLDLQTPLALFTPFVREFVFVDIVFGREQNPRSGEQESPDGLDLSAPVADCFPRLKNAFTPFASELVGPARAKLHYIVERYVHRYGLLEPVEHPELEPATMTETYRHRFSRRHIRIVRRRGFGFTTFRKYIDSIGVFFYRGDSLGDGGSGDLWLARVHLLELLDKLRNGGLIVTDGSNHGHGDRYYHDSRDNREYRSLWTYHGKRGLRPDPLPEPFNDRLGNRFECVGYAGQRGFGPVLIWQVWKPDAKMPEIKSPATASATPRILPGSCTRMERLMPEEGSDYTAPSLDEEKVLREFLEMPLENTNAVFKKFLDLKMPGTIYKQGEENFQEFLYIPGTRSDRVLLVAHADTYWDSRWHGNNGAGHQPLKELRIDLEQAGHTVYRNEQGKQSGCGLGADDRAGCAMLYLLRETGHSILVTNGEEPGKVGSKWLRENHPIVIGKINNDHQFVVQLDRHGSENFVHYGKATDAFEKHVKEEMKYDPERGSSSDIAILCDTVCGVNLSIGYYNEHSSAEYLKQDDWKKTLDRCRTWLKKKETPLPRFERPSD